ncbi:hypothetical protein CMV_029522 [Castanea mollissima]|uniref:Uncharacterized protein n=1 Tax=Castanea mollissima TaxID=60419 RepID=A0A8J4Q6I5_9ROSI|nr:hypothetical protein CMV_029522 [Castanea mollissima]
MKTPDPSFPRRTAYLSRIRVKNIYPQSSAIQALAISSCFVDSPRYSVPGSQPSPRCPKISLIHIWPSQHSPAALGAGQMQQYFGIFGCIS